MNRHVQLAICVVGIYFSFLYWAYLQEKLTSSNYSNSSIDPAYFKSPLIIHIIQSLFSIIIGTIYITTIGDYKPLLNNFGKSFFNLYIISISQTISSPLSYSSLNYVDYLLFLLTKSCKLIPVMLVHYILFGTKYKKSKYLVALIITIGVSIFTIATSSSKSNKHNNNGNNDQIYGFILLIASLLLDGFTNSAQDIMLKKDNSINGGCLMVGLNICTFFNLLIYTLTFTDQFNYIKTFVLNNGYSVIYDLLKFSLCGAIGQIFIFITLEKFSSVVLITVTVTRKMLSMAISVILFGHSLNLSQWFGIILVFAGIGLESALKIFKPKQKDKVL